MSDTTKTHLPELQAASPTLQPAPTHSRNQQTDNAGSLSDLFISLCIALVIGYLTIKFKK